MEGSVAHHLMTEEPLRIHELRAKNFKKLKTVTIIPDPDQRVLVLTGKNRQGKTSLIETIWICLLGERYLPPDPIREGEEFAEASIDFGEFIVSRRITARTTTLTVKGKDGFTAPSPQSFLSSRISGMIQNPLEFMRLKPDQQVKVLQGLVDLQLDLEEWNRVSGLPLKELPEDPIAVFDEAHQYLYKERGKANQEVDRLAGVVKSFTPPENWEAIHPVSVKELFAVRQRLEAQVREVEGAENTLLDLSEKASLVATYKMNIEENIRTAEETLSRLRADLLAKTGDLDNIQHQIRIQQDFIETLEVPDFTAIDAEIASADETNRLAARIGDWKKAVEEHRTAKARSINYTERMDALKDYKGRLIAAAGMPIDGLGFENGMVSYKGRPLSQASGAEQIEVSCAVCMASHPKIGLITLDSGWSELDRESQAVFKAWAEKVGAHVFVVKVAEEPQDEGWHFEDGEVTFINGQPAPPPVVGEESPVPYKKKRGRTPKNQESIQFGPCDEGVAVGLGAVPGWVGGQQEFKPPRLVPQKGE